MANLSVRFWGVRGSIACTEASTARVGGNTACVEVRCGSRLLIFDAGTGLRQLGKCLAHRWSARADIFLSHCHSDHICGLPFFAMCYQEEVQLHIWAGNLLPAYRLEQVLRRFLSDPYFPVRLETFKAQMEFHDFQAGEVLRPHPEVTLRTVALNHPGGATGYRVEHGPNVIAYVTDTEHRPDELDANVVALARGADLLIYDCNYTEDEFAAHVGWGHSTWQQGVRIAQAADVKKLALFHHDPDHGDDFLARVETAAQASFPGAALAVEGETLEF